MFQALPGTRDLFPPVTDRWRALVGEFAEHATRSGYGQVEPPMFEDLRVFLRVGEATDVVTKEMYDFVDKGERHIALRPEFTASLMRVFVETPPAQLPWKVWAWGPAFRYETPQAGRYRQFFQLDVECVGSADPDVDVEVIALAHDFYRAIGLRRFTLRLNTLGDATTRGPYLDLLRAYFAANLGSLSEQSQVTLAKNPLRVLDSKRAEDQEIILSAPKIADVLTDELAVHFERVQAGLRAVGIDYVLDARLVRGLDYYTHTLFEFAADSLDSAQNAIGGGGHYDNLVEQLGGPSTPGIGFALGVDRTLLACDAEGVFPAPSTAPEVFVVDTAGGREAVVLTQELRRAGIRAERAFDGRSMKSQLKASDRSGAGIAVVIGTNEVEQGIVMVRDLRTEDKTNAQRPVPRSDAVTELQRILRPFD